ncbi:uncharacterized protein TNCV_1367761 [Trichonephila clavipes]|nr:uncharacterized protein TNCV_1367761 [Trichonephila clavipes]
MCYADGICKTDKAQLIKAFEKKRSAELDQIHEFIHPEEVKVLPGRKISQEIITDDEAELERTFATLGKICYMYGVLSSSNVNDAHFYLFSKTCQSKKSDYNFEKKCRSFDLSSLPPCKAELYQHLLRVRTNTTRKPKQDDIDNGSSDDDVDYGGASVFCNTITERKYIFQGEIDSDYLNEMEYPALEDLQLSLNLDDS